MMEEVRLLKFLRRNGAAISGTTPAGKILLDGGDRGTVAFRADLVRRLIGEGTVLESGGGLRLTQDAGIGAEVKQGNLGHDVGLGRVADETGSVAEVLINHAESPLAALMRRKTKDGGSFLSQREFEAGERLRADFTRGAMMPRLGMNWSSALAPGKHRRTGGIADLTDAALGARLRVENALRAVGPELAGVLLDVCCFLKGLEQVESERHWPVRSAKVMLKSALGALARHYDPQASRKTGAILHWGSEDFRPDSI